ncbi:MAG TPA: hypothetical protein VKB88_28195 [Bryobacteraceae bacterium]|nr:hypothetical protein [Bryobacteraceae bacterium]
MRPVCVGWIVLVTTLFCALSSANGARIDVSRLDDGSALVLLQGDIELDDIAQFWARAATLSKATIAFRSDGGSLLAGIRIGALIRERGFITLVPDDARCASACAIAWLGGLQRLMGNGSKVGFHAAYVLKGHKPVESGPGNAVLGAYLFQLGLSEASIVYITEADPSSLNWLSLEQAAQHGIDVSPAPEEIHSATLASPVVSAALTSPVVKERPENDLEQRATDFIVAWASRWSSPNEEAFRSLNELYAEAVRYHGKSIPRQEVLIQKQDFAERWPERSYTLRPDSLSVTCVKGAETCSVKGIMNRLLVSGTAKTMARDVTSFEYRIAGLGETPHIVEETSSIVDEPALLARPRGRLRNWNPLSAVRRNLARLFANVSRSPAR